MFMATTRSPGENRSMTSLGCVLHGFFPAVLFGAVCVWSFMAVVICVFCCWGGLARRIALIGV